jgi:hypothetical protein
MSIQENNKLIAEFMQLPKVPCNIGTEDGHFTEGYKHPKIDVPIIPSGMQYHTSWGWLMDVLDKIFSLGYDYEIKPRYMVIKERLSSEVLVSKCFVYDKSQKEIIYDSVVEFINQYNKNK